MQCFVENIMAMDRMNNDVVFIMSLSVLLIILGTERCSQTVPRQFFFNKRELIRS